MDGGEGSVDGNDLGVGERSGEEEGEYGEGSHGEMRVRCKSGSVAVPQDVSNHSALATV